MPLNKPELQYTLWKIGELEDESPKSVSEQAKEALHERVFTSAIKEASTVEGGAPEWASSYFNLLKDGWPWRVAAYIAWMATPKAQRWPENQEKLATEVLGLNSDRVISNWRQNNPAIEQAIAALQTAELFEHRGEVLSALKESAANADYKHHPDRKLYLEMLGDYVPVSQLRALIASGQLKPNRGVKDLSEEELIRLAGGDLTVLVDDEALGEDEDA